MTPRQLELAKKAYRENMENQRQLMTIQAYQISRWVWQKTVDIDKILNASKITDTKKDKKVMTNDEMLNQVKMLNRLFGGEEVVDNG